jgi:hypothetical protein
MVQRQDQPCAPVLAQPRPCSDPVLRPPCAAGGGRWGHPGGLHPRGHFVWLLARRRQYRRPAYYSYAAPEPDGLRDQPLSAGAWVESGSGSLAILPYEAVRTASNPKTTLLAFCQSAYEAGARLASWDTTSFESTWCPTPDHPRAGHHGWVGRRTSPASARWRRAIGRGARRGLGNAPPPELPPAPRTGRWRPGRWPSRACGAATRLARPGDR